ncbi:SpoIIE family protein phosphatase [Mycolicibacterium tusciae]|uniref:SpoIIE family protein phosphatase n=1 Tax=Mycolicibacterium tusciae TaxID=75922 RepID=UPI0009F58300|nr:SpoIIE family protein phosphatase [Mycolicibacterium tusciae]
MFRHGKFGPIEWAAVRRPRSGEVVCGDHPVAFDIGEGGALFGVIDGLGHGEAAAVAAQLAAEVVDRGRADPLDVLIQRCHLALTETRGVAMTLACVDFEANELNWIGIGNVAADLVAKHPSGVEVRSSALLVGGIVGYRIPQSLSPTHVPISPGDLLVMSSDGIAEQHLNDIDFAAHATTIAEQLVGRYGRETDDALVLAARHRGTA